MSKSDAKKIPEFVHVVLVLAVMFGFGALPPVFELTEVGMKIIGILIGLIYGVSFCTPVWPCLFGTVALIATGVAPLATVLSTGIGSDSIMVMIFLFGFVAVMEEYKVTEFLAAWLMTRKVVEGKPWLFSYFLIVGTMLAGAFGSSFPAMMVFWGILIATCKLYDMKPFTKYPTLMFIGICIGGLASSSTWLFRGNPLFVNSMLKGITNGEYFLNFGIYAFFSFIMWMIVIAGYIMFCKYIVKVDLGPMKNIDASVVDKSYLVLNKKQKVVFGYAVLMLVLYCFVGFTPAESALGQFLAPFGTTGPAVALLALMAITRIDGEPLVNVGKALKNGVLWDTAILAGTVRSCI